VVDAASLPNLFASIQQELLCGDIHIKKTPDPAGPVNPGTSVTYTYKVSNSGDTPLTNVTVSDDTCSPVVLVSGKTGNNLLENGEIWVYQCTMPLQATTKNEACADGNFIGGGHDSACDDVTVEVLQPTPVATPMETPVVTPVVTPTPEQSVEAATGTPAPSQPDTAVDLLGDGSLPVVVFTLLLVTSLGALAFANVQALRRGR
jgi:uncharacterized repeat protein (TIGR01451 family)